MKPNLKCLTKFQSCKYLGVGGNNSADNTLMIMTLLVKVVSRSVILRGGGRPWLPAAAHSTHSTLHTARCTIHSADCTAHCSTHHTLYTLSIILYNAHSTLHCISHTLTMNCTHHPLHDAKSDHIFQLHALPAVHILAEHRRVHTGHCTSAKVCSNAKVCTSAKVCSSGAALKASL